MIRATDWMSRSPRTKPFWSLYALKLSRSQYSTANGRLSRTWRSISSWMRMLPGNPVSGERFRISFARRSVPFTRARSSIGSNGLMM